MTREIKFFQAINEATDQCMRENPAVYIMGLGVPDPKGIFGTTLGLKEKYGNGRVMDMPCSENAMTGVAIGSALAGMRPIMTHQRIDFALLAVEQLVNQAANWHYMFAGKMKVPMVVRLLIGRGWGQGPQHSQSFQAWFAHVPGLKVVMPTTPYDAKGLLIAAVEDDDPIIFIEHRWLHNITGNVPTGMYRVPIGQARVMRQGTDLTIVATSYMALESLRAATILADNGIDVEVVDVRTLKPLDEPTILESVCRTGRLIVADAAWRTCGFAAEIIALAAEKALDSLKCPPERVTLPDCPTPTSPALANRYYPRAAQIVDVARRMLEIKAASPVVEIHDSAPLDVPDRSFTGPF